MALGPDNAEEWVAPKALLVSWKRCPWKGGIKPFGPEDFSSWEVLEKNIYEKFRMDPDSAALHLAYSESYKGPDGIITKEQWISSPRRLEFFEGDPQIRQLYVDFAWRLPWPTDEADAYRGITDSLGSKEQRVPTWWSACFWKFAPREVHLFRKGSLVDTGMQQYRLVGVKPEWFETYARPGWNSASGCQVRPQDAESYVDKGTPQFLKPSIEIRQMVYSLLLDFSGIEAWLEKISLWSRKGHGRRSVPPEDDRRYIFHTPPILLVNKLISQEAIDFLHLKQLRLHRPIERKSWLRWSVFHFIRPALVSRLRNVSLVYELPAEVQSRHSCKMKDFRALCHELLSFWYSSGHRLIFLEFDILETNVTLEQYCSSCRAVSHGRARHEIAECLSDALRIMHRCQALPGLVREPKFGKALQGYLQRYGDVSLDKIQELEPSTHEKPRIFK